MFSKKIIVIDDSRVARQRVAQVLAEAGYGVVEAIDGKDGLEKIAANADANAVICDINMPRLSGIEMLAEAKTTQIKLPPVLMLTTEGQPELVKEAKELGAKGWIIKPFKPDLLVAAVRRLAG